MTKKKKKNNRILFIIISIIIVIVIVLLSIFLLNRNKPVPFVKKNGIKISSAKKEYTNPIYPYSKDADTGIFLNTDKIKFKNTSSHYKFTNLKKEKNSILDKYSFDIEIETPIKYTSTYIDAPWTYSYSAIDPIIFDYYTGEVYRVGIDVEDNSLIGVGINNENRNMKYTTIEWNNKEYKIGVLKKYNSKWAGKKVNKVKNGTKVYRDKNIGKTTVKIDVPKGYNGLMIAILKKGSNKKTFELDNTIYEEYERLFNEYQQTGIKSEELNKLDEKRDKVISLFDSNLNKDTKYTKDDYYVIRVKNIPKAK